MYNDEDISSLWREQSIVVVAVVATGILDNADEVDWGITFTRARVTPPARGGDEATLFNCLSATGQALRQA